MLSSQLLEVYCTVGRLYLSPSIPLDISGTLSSPIESAFRIPDTAGHWPVEGMQVEVVPGH